MFLYNFKMQSLDIYSHIVISSYCELDTKLIVKRLNTYFRNINAKNIVKNLSDKYIDVTEMSKFLMSIRFALASYNCSKRIIKYLIKTRESYFDKCMCFEWACRSGNLDFVWFMINLVEPYEKKWITGLWSAGLRGACVGKHRVLIDYLLDKGAIINETVLARAVDGSDISIIKMFLDKGVKIRTRTNVTILQNNPMYMAGVRGNMQIIDILLKKFNTKKDIDYCMYGACRGKHSDVIKRMISLGTSKLQFGFYDIYREKHHDIIKMMLDNISDNELRNIFKTVCNIGDLEFVKLLYSYKNNALSNYNSGFTTACRNGHMSVVKYLLESGSKPTITAFRFACLCEQYDIVMILIEYMTKNKIEYCDEGLDSSCMSGDMKLINLMIEKGATSFNKGLTEGCRKGYDKVVRCMIEHGATQCEYCNFTIEQHMNELKYEMIIS